MRRYGGRVQLLLLALEAALYPTLLAAVVILLTLERPIPLLAAYLAGALVVSIGLGLAIVLVLGDSGALDTSRSGLSVGADLALGAVSLLFAVALAMHADERLRRNRSPAPKRNSGQEPWSQRILSRGSAPLVFVAAMVVNLPGAAYLIALKDIAAGHHATATDVALILAFNLVMFALAEIPLLGLVFAPERTHALVGAANAWTSSHGRQIAIAICASFGVFLVVRGIAHAG